MKCIGIIPAAGLGTRLSPLPFSKELFPLGYQKVNKEFRPCPVSQHLVAAMKAASVENIFFIINTRKTDIQTYFSNGKQFNINFSYLIQAEPKGLVDAISQATPWLPSNEEILIFFGMPDTLFKPKDIYKTLRKTMEDNTNIDILLGLFPTDAWHKLGMTEVGDINQLFSEIVNIIDKPQTKPNTNLAWGVAVWRGSFQKFLTNYVNKNDSLGNEIILGDIFIAAKEAGLSLFGTKGEEYLDTGTVEDLVKAIDHMNRIDFGNPENDSKGRK